MDDTNPLSPPDDGGDGSGGTNSSGGGIPLSQMTFPTNGLWMQLNGITNGIASLSLNNATSMVYEIWSADSLTNALPLWNIEQEVFADTNNTSTAFTVPILDRTNNLFFFARD